MVGKRYLVDVSAWEDIWMTTYNCSNRKNTHTL